MEEGLKSADVAIMLNVSRPVLSQLIKRGTLKRQSVRPLRIEKKSVMELLERRKIEKPVWIKSEGSVI